MTNASAIVLGQARERPTKDASVATLAHALAVAAPGRVMPVVVRLAAQEAVLVVEAAAERAARRVAPSHRRVEVELAHDGRAVARLAQQLREQDHLAAQCGPALRRGEAELPAMAAGEECRTGRRAPGRRAEAREVHGVACQRVQARRLHQRRACIARVGESEIISHEDGDVWRPVRTSIAAPARRWEQPLDVRRHGVARVRERGAPNMRTCADKGVINGYVSAWNTHVER